MKAPTEISRVNSLQISGFSISAGEHEIDSYSVVSLQTCILFQKTCYVLYRKVGNCMHEMYQFFLTKGRGTHGAASCGTATDRRAQLARSTAGDLFFREESVSWSHLEAVAAKEKTGEKTEGAHSSARSE